MSGYLALVYFYSKKNQTGILDVAVSSSFEPANCEKGFGGFERVHLDALLKQKEEWLTELNALLL